MTASLRRLIISATVLAALLSAEARAATIGLNFTGSNQSQSGVFVPDTMGAVGRNHIVELLNGVYAVYDKGTGQQLQRMSMDTFWSQAGRRGGISLVGNVDPRVVYDPTVDRWYAVTVGENAVNLGVSISGDPTFPLADLTRGWKGFALDGDPANEPNTRLADFPTLGFDANGVYTAWWMLSEFRLFPARIDFSIVSIPKADLLSSSPTLANRSVFEVSGADYRAAGALTSIQPVIDVGPSDGRAPLFQVNARTGMDRWELANTGVQSPGQATLSAPSPIAIEPFIGPPVAEQPGNARSIWANGVFTGPAAETHDRSRFISNLVQQGDSVWGVHPVDANGRAGVRWYELDAETGVVRQSGTIADPALALIYPSIAVNPFGDAVIGFTATGEDKFPSAYAVVGDTVGGVTTFGPLLELKAGAATFQGLDSFGRNRWGDYSTTVVDPSDPLRFWTFQEFASENNQWAVQITQIITDPAGSSWNTDADGNWSAASHWNSGVPNAVDAAAILGSAIRQARTVTVDTPITLGHLKFDSTNSYTIAGANALTFDRALGDAQFNVVNGNHTIRAPITLAKPTLINISAPTSNLSITGALDASGVSLTKAGNGTLTVNNIRAAALSINAGTVTIAPNGTDAATSRVGALSFALTSSSTARLDLTNNAAIVDYSETSPATLVRQLIFAGRGGPGLGKGWNGRFITSSAAAAANAAEPESRSVGYAENATLPLGPYTTFHGQAVDSTSVLIAYTRTGDANLDGIVNDDDVTIVGATYAPGVANAHWALGDFDYNGFVDDDDVTLLGAFYDPAAVPLIAAAPLVSGGVVSGEGVAAVPEPSTVVLLAMMAAGAGLLWAGRRGRRIHSDSRAPETKGCR